MGAAASVERALAKEPDQLSRAECEELAARHGVALKKSLFSVLGARDGTVAKAAVVRFCQLDALAHGTCGVAAAAKAPASKAARKTTREVVRRTLLAKGSSRLSNGTAATTEAGASPKVTLEAMKEGRARRGTLPRETDAPPDGPRRRRTPSMYLGAPAPKRESHVEKRLRASLRALGAEARIRMHQLETELEKAASIERRTKRLEALRAQAEQALAAFAELPLEQQQQAKNEGSLALYTPENLERRESIREDPRVEIILQKWWAASARYDDRDRDEMLSRSEYAAFHDRLLELHAALGLDDEPLTDAEKNRVLEQDFALDSGGANGVDEEKFLHAVFQVADQWVDTIEAGKYAEFLERAYDVVYRDLVDSDSIRPPDDWAPHLRVKAAAKTPWSVARTCEFTTEMYRLKLAGRAKPKVWGKTFGHFVLRQVKDRFGPGNYRRELSAFVRRILEVIEAPGDTDPAIFSWLLLFAQLAGFHSRSSRLPALPGAAEKYVLDVLAAITALVNNAGVIGAGGRHVDATDQLETASTKDFDAVMSTNVLGSLICCREAAKRMPRGSTIVNLGSISTKAGSPLIYAMTKGALMSMQRGLVPTLGAKGIRINTVSPGLVVTDMTTELFQDPAIRAAVKTQYPLGRFGAPEDIAGAGSYLCSDDAAWTSGTDLLVAGGVFPQ